MKEFLKMTLAVIVGFLVVSIISTIFSLIVLFGLIASVGTPEKATISENTVMKVSLSGVLAERSTDDTYASLMGALGSDSEMLGLDDLRSAFKKAATDDKVVAVYLEGGMLSAAPAQIEELRTIIAKFKESGKPIYAYADTYSQGGYWLSSIADVKWMNPKGSLMLNGMVSNTMFMKRALDKLGVEMQIFKVGTFKSAVEPYFLTEMSEANRKQNQQYIDGIWAKMKSDIGNPNIQKFADEGAFFSAAERTVELGFIDSLVYGIDVADIIEKKLGKDDVKFSSYKKVNSAISNPSNSTHEVAVLYAEGAIDGGSDDGISSEKIAKQLEKLRKDDDVKAVVLRIHSPGGSAYGSEQMWYAAEKLRQEKPLIVSMSGYAASGGYYMACNADTILALNSTLTGSIGIFGTFPNAAGLTDKVGLDFDGVKTAKYADFGSIYRPMTTGEKALLQHNVNEGYELFTSRCAEGRGMNIDSLKLIAEGRVWTGSDAKNLGLVDEIGGLDRAVEIAAEKAGLANYKETAYPKKKDFMTQIMEELGGDVQMYYLSQKFGVAAQYLPMYDRVMNMRGVQAIMPYTLVVE